MKKRIDSVLYTDEPMKIGSRVKDFLPSPEELIFKEDSKKVTIAITKRSLDFFKSYARTHKIKYQTMIRKVLDEYALRSR